MNIILIGFMGAGKTTIGRKLAQELNYKHIDVDAHIIALSNRESIVEIFDNDGEIRFRELELAATKELQNTDNTVISTGGGIVMNKLNIDYLKKNGQAIYLKTTLETAKKRVGEKKARPLFQDPTKTKKLYALRQPIYESYANIVIETDDKLPDDVVSKILNEINLK